MFCPKCGAQNPDGAKFCAGCGQPMQASASSPQAQTEAQASVAQQAQVGTQAAAAPQPQAGAAPIAAKPISRRNLIIGAGLGIVAIGGVAFGLTRCTGGFGGKKGVIPTYGNGEYAPFSVAISNGRTIWYRYNDGDSLDREARIERAYVFENGKITRYIPRKYEGGVTVDVNYSINFTDPLSYVTFEDLNGLSDDDIVKKLAEWDEQNFNYEKQNALDKLNLARTGYDENGNVLEKDYECDRATAIDRKLALANNMIAEKGWTAELAPYTQQLTELATSFKDVLNKQLEIFNAVTYQAPQPTDYKLYVVPDGSGNYTEKETFAWLNTSVNFEPKDDYDSSLVGKLRGTLENLFFHASTSWGIENAKSDLNNIISNLKTELSECSTVDIAYETKQNTLTCSSTGNTYATIYDKNYCGFGRFVCLIDEDAYGVTFDAPSDSAVEVVSSVDDINLEG